MKPVRTYRSTIPFYGQVPLVGGTSVDDGRFAGMRLIRNVVHYATCGCHPVIHRYKCAACGTVVGWCVGADTEWLGDPEVDGGEVCDVCWEEARIQSECDLYNRARRKWMELRARRRHGLA